MTLPLQNPKCRNKNELNVAILGKIGNLQENKRHFEQ